MSTPTRPLTQEKDAITELLAVDGSLLLRVRKNAIQRLRRLIYEGVRAIPQQPGLEIGGLCVASKPVAWGLTETVIDFVPVEIQYQYGPRFRACPADRAVFEDAMAQQQTDGESRVVGCFRSHLAVDLQIRTEDRWLMNTVLGERGGFLMLVQPMFDEVCVFSFGPGGTPLDTLPVGRFSLRDGGPEVEKSKRTELPGPAPDPSFASRKAESYPVVSGPLASDQAASTRLASVIAASPGGITVVPGSIRNPEALPAESPIRPETPREARKNVWLVPLAVLFLVLAIFFFVARTPSAASQTGLAISNKGSTVEITWNIASPVVKRATRATLFTSDDLRSSQVNLTAAQVHAGHYEYPRAAGDVFCEVTFYQPNNTFVGETKTIRLKASNGATPASQVLPQQPSPVSLNASASKPAPGGHAAFLADGLPSKPVPDNHTRSAADGLLSKPTPDNQADSAADTDPDSGETFVVKSARVPFVPPPSKEVVRGPVIARPPEVQGNSAPVGAALPPVVMALKPPPPPVTPPVTPPARAAAPVAQSVTFTAAVPLKRVPPVIPSGARALLHEPVVVTVVVDVDGRGKVTAARLSGDNKGVRQLLAPNCVQAARLWQFEPALRNGVPVASQTELSFRFSSP